MRASVAILAMLAAVSASATDHNNLDSGRPLRFDDAYSIAYRERAVETGLTLDRSRRSSLRYGLKTEFKYGFAKNQDLGIGLSPSYSTDDRRGDLDHVELSYFNGLRREIGDQPAVGFRVDVGLPTGRERKSGADVLFRGILTKTVNQYDRMHLNLDVTTSTERRAGERQTTLGAIVGYSKPIGYPTQFDRTLVAHFALEQARERGRGWTGGLGLGLRQQVGVRSVLDFGVESDLFETKGKPKSALRFAIGYSIGF